MRSLRSLILAGTVAAAILAPVGSGTAGDEKGLATREAMHLTFLEWEAGVWDARITMSDPATGKVQEFVGEQIDRMGACGLWLITDLKLVPDESGQEPPPYEGHGVLGYDPVKDKLVGLWVDGQTKWLATAEGTLDGSALTLDIESRNPMTGEPMPQRFVTTKLSENKKRLETFVPGPNGQFIKIASIDYERRK